MKHMITILEQSARAAGALIMSYFRVESNITRKTSHNDLVTIADVSSQAIIKDTVTKELIRRGIPESEIGFIGEENLSTDYRTHMFIIDPLDGTNNFASGLDYFAVSIAYFYKGIPTDAVIYWPARNTLYSASKNKGAYKKDNKGVETKLAVRDELLENSVLFTYLSSRTESIAQQFSLIQKISPQVRGVRIYGSSCIDLVHLVDRENSAHIVFYSHTCLWDLAAAYLIIYESGGICTDLRGNEIVLDISSGKRDFEVIAAHPNVVKELLRSILHS